MNFLLFKTRWDLAEFKNLKYNSCYQEHFTNDIWSNFTVQAYTLPQKKATPEEYYIKTSTYLALIQGNILFEGEYLFPVKMSKLYTKIFNS